MYKFKNSLIAIGGLLALTGLIALMTPHKGYGSGGSTSASPAGQQPTNVNVINTPGVNAQQSGEWSVSLNGTPSVNIANTPIVQLNNSSVNPLLVRDVDVMARQPFQLNIQVGLGSGILDNYKTFTVPAGKRLVIEYVSGRAGLGDNQLPSFQLGTFTNGDANPTPHYLAAQQTTPGFGLYVISQPVRIYADAGSLHYVAIVRGSGEGTADVHVSISGYLENVP
jgi:hypothetical protein